MGVFDLAAWQAGVQATLREHPDWAAGTAQAMQAGLLNALDDSSKRASTLSLGLMEALDTKPGSKKRNGKRIVEAVEASEFHPTEWSKKVIAREAARPTPHTVQKEETDASS